MFSKIVNLARNSKLHTAAARSFSTTTPQAGVLYTWGQFPLSLGYNAPNDTVDTSLPHQIEEFGNSVTKVSMGPHHTAILTDNGEVFTCGSGKYGELGHGKSGEVTTRPNVVSYFRDNNLKVKDVACGKYHTLALTDNGELFSWGWGGQTANVIKRALQPSGGALGHGYTGNKAGPTNIEGLHGKAIKSITSGENFAIAVDGNGIVYNWGEGSGTVFGNGDSANVLAPAINEYLKKLSETKHAKIVKVKSAGNATLALLDNGSVYAWGDNDSGQLGQYKEIGIKGDTEVETPAKVDDTNFKGKKIVDFDLGRDTAIFKTESGEVFWSGLELVYSPIHWKLPEGAKVKKVVASEGSFAAVTTDNKIYVKGDFMHISDASVRNGVHIGNTSAFRGAEVLSFGGNYKNRWAIVKQ
jgi:RCC1 and BTB domain-containing protein